MRADRETRAGHRRGVRALFVMAAALLVPVVVPAHHADRLRLAAAVDSSGNVPITIGTVPSVAGFPVVLDGVTAFTDAAGNAHFTAPPSEPDQLADRITLKEADIPIGGQLVRVAADRLYPSATTPVLALSLSYLVRFGFTDQDGRPIAASSVGRMTVKSVTGELLHVAPGKATWLQGSRVVPMREGLRVKKLEWSLQAVTYSGSNVVNSSQQRFVPADQQDVPITLLFFGISLHVHDAMFGFPNQGAVELTFPDGHTQRYPLDPHGRLRVGSLPRGNYTLTTMGPGPKLARPLAVSRDQDLDLSFYSWWDVLVVLGGGVAVAVGLALVGRRRRRRNTASVAHRPGVRASTAPTDESPRGEDSTCPAPPSTESPFLATAADGTAG